MAQAPLNAEGGEATKLSVRVSHDADQRIDALADRTGMRRSDAARWVLALGLERAELADTEPLTSG